jgi:hypothetical protein
MDSRSVIVESRMMPFTFGGGLCKISSVFKSNVIVGGVLFTKTNRMCREVRRNLLRKLPHMIMEAEKSHDVLSYL